VLYDIRLVIAYDYDRPAVTGRHILRLMPANLPGLQRRLKGVLDISPEPAERGELTDFFGNDAVEIAFREAHDEIVFQVTARVERLAVVSGLDISPPLARLAAEMAAHRGLEADAPHHFPSPSPSLCQPRSEHAASASTSPLRSSVLLPHHSPMASWPTPRTSRQPSLR
jgi:transglutaminase-like putative cysteine protease